MPVWHERTLKARREGRLQLVGLVQDQHPDRARLFMQWKQMDWPVLVDALNVTGTRVVPILRALDEHGVVRAVGPRLDIETFLRAHYPAVSVPRRPAPQALAALRSRASTAGGARALGDALFLRAHDLDGAIEAYRKAGRLDPGDGRNDFRLGVALRRRYESDGRRPGDFQAAVDHWTLALHKDPGQYIWRRRLQQYGPRLAKPYNFFGWVAEARRAIEARGQTPVPLAVEPRGTELAGRIPALRTARTPSPPDPAGKIPRDRQALVEVETVVVPAFVGAGRPVKVHLIFRPTERAEWNNEGDPLRAWMTAPDGWQADARVQEAAASGAATSREARILEFELRAPREAEPGPVRIPVRAFYDVCRESDGACQRLCRDIPVEVRVADPAPPRPRR